MKEATKGGSGITVNNHAQAHHVVNQAIGHLAVAEDGSRGQLWAIILRSRQLREAEPRMQFEDRKERNNVRRARKAAWK